MSDAAFTDSTTPLITRSYGVAHPGSFNETTSPNASCACSMIPTVPSRPLQYEPIRGSLRNRVQMEFGSWAVSLGVEQRLIPVG